MRWQLYILLDRFAIYALGREMFASKPVLHTMCHAYLSICSKRPWTLTLRQEHVIIRTL